MSPTLMLSESATATEQTLALPLAAAHDRWMTDCDNALGPVTDSDATFLQRWAAVRYVSETFPERFDLEQEFLQEMRPFIVPEIRERLTMQVERLTRLQQDLQRLAQQPGAARELAHTARELLEALRLWYAEIEFALGDLRQKEVGRRANRLLDRFTGCAWLLSVS